MKDIKKQNLFKKYTILYAEDNKEISEEIAFFLEPQFKEFYIAYNGVEGLELFEQHKPDIIITDIQMPKMNGIDMIEKIREFDNDVSIIITTAFNESHYLLKAIELQVDGYLMKPLNMKELITKVQKILEPIELKKELYIKNKELIEINDNLDEIVKKKTQELAYLYNHDPQTGLLNFISLAKAIESDEYKYVVLLDISNFSLINKQYGKIFANSILKETAHILKKHTNSTIKLFKTESDRFVFILREPEREKIEFFCQQIISFFDTETIVVDGFNISINFSIGVAPTQTKCYPVVNAEFALESGKKVGTRYYHFYNEVTDGLEKTYDVAKRLDITKKMIQSDSIEPFYQPIVDTQTGEVVKYEVLARGNYEGEYLSPYYFIAEATKLGLVNSITRMMINKSFDYFEERDISFSINITQRDLLDKYLTVFLDEKLKIYNIKASRVTFEVLENITLGEEQESVLKQLVALKKMGFKIAIDDFGIENSNFSRLLKVDFDYIKLDGILVKGLVENKKDRVVISAIVGMAKTLGIKTIAEYVESKEVYEIIKEIGVDMAQGHYIGKPLAMLEEEEIE